MVKGKQKSSFQTSVKINLSYLWNHSNLPACTLGRVYAAYGGIFIVSSLGGGAPVDKKRPDRYEINGA